MLKINILLVLSMLGSAYAQASHESLSLALLKQLQSNISDSTGVELNQQSLVFDQKSLAVDYLTNLSGKTHKMNLLRSDSHSVDIGIQLKSLSLSINSDPSETLRNTLYIRQLDLDVDYMLNGQEYSWQGRLSDKLSSDDLRKLLNEYFPTPITGDFRDSQPSAITIIIITLGILSLVASLYFIRT